MEKPHEKGPLINNLDVSQFSVLTKGLLKINNYDNKNNCVLLADGSYVQCYNFVMDDANVKYIIGRPFKIVSSFYREPIDSRNLNIVIAKVSDKPLKIFECNSIVMKVYTVPLINYFVLCPISHTLEQ